MGGVRFDQRTADRTTGQRFEAKYLIPESVAHAIADYIQPYVNADIHARDHASYPITSLYLDSPGYRLYWSSRLGERSRFKLRVRTYSDDRESPAFLEVKRRHDFVVSKLRAAVERDAVPGILAGAPLSADMLVRCDARTYAGLYEFRDLASRIGAVPAANIRYVREAYVSRMEEPVRITFDRELACAPHFAASPDDWAIPHYWRPVGGVDVVLEVKFTDAYPRWVAGLIRRFHLLRDSMAKYVLGLQCLSREGALARPISSEEYD